MNLAKKAFEGHNVSVLIFKSKNFQLEPLDYSLVNLTKIRQYINKYINRGDGMATPDKYDAAGYWKATLRLTISLLIIWFAASYGAGILFREALDNFSIGGAPLGFWFAQNGSIYVFLILIVIYCRKMTQYEKKFGISD